MFKVLFEQPLYNALVSLIGAFPLLDLGMVIIIFTIIVKLVLAPLTFKALKSQQELKNLEPEMKKLKEKYKDDKNQLGIKTLELYREKKINPFASIVPILIQLPILFALYFVFLNSGLPRINPELLYSFVTPPTGSVSTLFLNIVDVTQKSIPLALLTALAQFIQTKYSLKHQTLPDTNEKTFAADFTRSMNFQMVYILPIFIGFVSYSLNAATSLYFIVSSLFQLVQEIYMRKKINGSETIK